MLLVVAQIGGKNNYAADIPAPFSIIECNHFRAIMEKQKKGDALRHLPLQTT
jgi:hypothetical protein